MADVKRKPESQPAAAAFPRRAEGARRTRAALVTAAGELFVELGYAATTVSAIAHRAGVGRATVFTSVPGGKPELLKLARDVALAGDDEPVPVPDRAWFREAMATTNPEELIRLQARNYRNIHDRAAAESELADLLHDARTQRAAGARTVIARLVELEAIQPAAAEQSADTLYALASPDLFLLLTKDRHWNSDQYQAWLTKILIAELLIELPGHAK
jgi:AcrR family transcriptional regulator